MTLWQQIIQEIVKINPAIQDSLNPPATPAQIQQLTDFFGVALPDSFKDYLRVCNGQNHQDYQHLLLGYQAFLSVEEILEMAKMQYDLFGDEPSIDFLTENKIQPVYWDKKWIAFTDYEASNRLVIDFHAGKNGLNGQILQLSPEADLQADETVISVSFDEFSQKILATLQAQDYHLNDDVIEIDWLI